MGEHSRRTPDHNERWHARLFRMILNLYPRSFRDACGADMAHYFLDRLARARSQGGRLEVLRLWIRTAGDLVKTAALERSELSSRRNERMGGDAPMSTLLQDLRYASRRLLITPLFTVSAIAILAAGLGLNTAVFSMVDAMLLRPPPFASPERIVHIYEDSDDGEPSSTSYPVYQEISALSEVFGGVAATSSSNATWETVHDAVPVDIEYATASYFPVLGLLPHRGRWFAPQHDLPGEEMVAVVSHHTWRTKMGADPNVVGQAIRLNNQPVTLIGIGPESFNGDAGAMITDFWLSISSARVGGALRVANLERRQDHWYQAIARLAPGVSVERAQSAITGVAHRLANDWPEHNAGRDITVFGYGEVRFHPEVDGILVKAGLGLTVVAGLVLLLACSNLGNLLLVRGVARGTELAVRQALGAGRGRIVRLLMLEALLLAGLGGAAGLLLALSALKLLPLVPLPIASLDVGFDHRLVIFGATLAVGTGLLFGALPAFSSTRIDVASRLRDEGRGLSGGRGVTLLRGTLVAMQVAVSLVLIVGAGLLARSLANAERVDLGVDSERIAVLGTNLQQAGVSSESAPALIALLLERVEALPGVDRAAITTRLPVQGGGTTTQVIEGYSPPGDDGTVELPFASVSRGYFETMGIPLRAGRAFSAVDASGTPKVVIVNETAARTLWNGDAVGGRIRSEGDEIEWKQVVGVVADVKVSTVQEAPTPMIYYAAEQTGMNAFAVVARTSGDPAALAGALRRTVREAHSSLPVTRLGSFEKHLGEALALPRATAVLLGGFSVLALLLATIGVHAVVSFSVERRSRELGIRVALGASGSRLVRMVVTETLIVVASGVIAGAALAAVAMRGLEGVLFGVKPMDAATFAGASLLLIVSAAAAAFVPARSAARADPLEALKRQ